MLQLRAGYYVDGIEKVWCGKEGVLRIRSNYWRRSLRSRVRWCSRASHHSGKITAELGWDGS